jgi:hypothetical protein
MRLAQRAPACDRHVARVPLVRQAVIDHVCVLTAITRNWLRVLGTAELPHLDQGVRQSFHAKVSLLHVFKTKKQPIERILPRKGPIDASPQGMNSDV